MFRKKDTETESPSSAERGFRWPAGEAASTIAQPDLARRKVELSTGPGAIAGAPSSGTSEPGAGPSAPHAEPDPYGKRLIVGEGIRLSGEISSCDRLVVQGEVEVTLNDTLALEIARSGRFTGGCEVEEADISGVYEGDLTVRKHLCVRGTGKLTGTIRYAQLELERGGQIAGNISVINPESGSSKTTAPRMVDRRSPMFVEAGSEEAPPKAS
jgi:cytoskeletal protein CcmA (bactofilin family)